MNPEADAPSVIDGTWQLIRAELDGERAPDVVVAKTEVMFERGCYEVRFAGQIADRGSCMIEEVNVLILQGVEGHNRGRTIPCIYQIIGERLRICYGLGGVIPAEFATATGQQRYLATYRRKAT